MGSRAVLPDSKAYSPQTQQNSPDESGLGMYQYLPVGSRANTWASSPTNNAPSLEYTFPGPLLQFVGTDTPIYGRSDVAESANVGVNVCVGVRVWEGVKVGSAGVNVSVGGGSVVEGLPEKAVCENPTITV